MPFPYQILPLAEAHLPQIMAIERSVFDKPWSMSLMKDSLISAHTQGWGIFDEYHHLLAFVLVSVIFDEAEILDISVSKEYQNQGFGQKLLAFLLNHLAYKGVEKLFLEVGVNNKPALAIYRKYGFKQLLIRKDYYINSDNSTEDAIVMQAVLQPQTKG
ncbi:MAG: ribosomal protein S18-alanine N-acetyltransferase [Francisellaceae bacterium]